jgi:hypothetical protein
MLTGQELLEKVKQYASMPRNELMTLCGYSVTREDGRTTLKTTEFMSALLEAQGIALQPSRSAAGGGRALTYYTKCQKNGNIALGAGYISKSGLSTGDAYEVSVSKGKIVLKPVK